MSFSEWFKNQFGRLPADDEQITLKCEISRIKKDLSVLEKALAEEELLSAQYTAALYAWRVMCGENDEFD